MRSARGLHVGIVSETRANAEALCEALERCDEISGTQVYTSVDAARRASRGCAIGVLVVDLRTAPGVPLAIQLAAVAPRVRVLAIGVSEDEREIAAWAHAGVRGCVTRQSSLADVARAVVAVGKGECVCLSETTHTVFLREARRSAGDLRTARFRHHVLTEREAEVLGLIADGLTNRQIATALSVQLPTVKNHVQSILKKLGVRDRERAVEVARAVHAD